MLLCGILLSYLSTSVTAMSITFTQDSHGVSHRHKKKHSRKHIRSKKTRFNETGFADLDVDAPTPSRENAKKYIKEMMQFAWEKYAANGLDHDARRPVTGDTDDRWGHHAISLIDSLSTLYIMGLKDEFHRGVHHLRVNLPTLLENNRERQSVFETIIRSLGGLLGAHSLCVEDEPEVAAHLLNLAQGVADRLMPAFENRLVPCPSIELATGHTSGCGGSLVLAEVGSFGMEFRYLSHHTKDSKYKEAADRAMFALTNSSNRGLISNNVDLIIHDSDSHDSKKTNLRMQQRVSDARDGKYSLSAMGDSYYEYLLKMYLLSCKSEEDTALLQKFRMSMKEAQHMLIHDVQSNDGFPQKMAMVSAADQKGQQQHLGCFAGGMFTLGHYALKDDVASKTSSEQQSVPAVELESWKETGQKISTFCAESYARSPSGIGPEIFNEDFSPSDDRFLLRPETAESIYYMLHFTGDESWRDRSWRIAKALNKHARSKYGFSSLDGVSSHSPLKLDDEESFFFAELLKYLYLAHTTKAEFDPTVFILTTEAHPLKRFCDAE